MEDIDNTQNDGGVKNNQDKSRDELGRLLPGQSSLNPKGRPKGTITVIGRLKQIFEEDPEKFEKFIKDYSEDPNNRKHITEMIDGKPKQTIAGDSENPLRIITVDKDLAEIHDITPSEPEDNS